MEASASASYESVAVRIHGCSFLRKATCFVALVLESAPSPDRGRTSRTDVQKRSRTPKFQTDTFAFRLCKSRSSYAPELEGGQVHPRLFITANEVVKRKGQPVVETFGHCMLSLEPALERLHSGPPGTKVNHTVELMWEAPGKLSLEIWIDTAADYRTLYTVHVHGAFNLPLVDDALPSPFALVKTVTEQKEKKQARSTTTVTKTTRNAIWQEPMRLDVAKNVPEDEGLVIALVDYSTKKYLGKCAVPLAEIEPSCQYNVGLVLNDSSYMLVSITREPSVEEERLLFSSNRNLLRFEVELHGFLDDTPRPCSLLAAMHAVADLEEYSSAAFRSFTDPGANNRRLPFTTLYVNEPESLQRSSSKVAYITSHSTRPAWECSLPYTMGKESLANSQGGFVVEFFRCDVSGSDTTRSQKKGQAFFFYGFAEIEFYKVSDHFQVGEPRELVLSVQNSDKAALTVLLELTLWDSASYLNFLDLKRVAPLSSLQRARPDESPQPSPTSAMPYTTASSRGPATPVSLALASPGSAEGSPPDGDGGTRSAPEDSAYSALSYLARGQQYQEETAASRKEVPVVVAMRSAPCSPMGKAPEEAQGVSKIVRSSSVDSLRLLDKVKQLESAVTDMRSVNVKLLAENRRLTRLLAEKESYDKSLGASTDQALLSDPEARKKITVLAQSLEAETTMRKFLQDKLEKKNSKVAELKQELTEAHQELKHKLMYIEVLQGENAQIPALKGTIKKHEKIIGKLREEIEELKQVERAEQAAQNAYSPLGRDLLLYAEGFKAREGQLTKRRSVSPARSMPSKLPELTMIQSPSLVAALTLSYAHVGAVPSPAGALYAGEPVCYGDSAAPSSQSALAAPPGCCHSTHTYASAGVYAASSSSASAVVAVLPARCAAWSVGPRVSPTPDGPVSVSAVVPRSLADVSASLASVAVRPLVEPSLLVASGAFDPVSGRWPAPLPPSLLASLHGAVGAVRLRVHASGPAAPGCAVDDLVQCVSVVPDASGALPEDSAGASPSVESLDADLPVAALSCPCAPDIAVAVVAGRVFLSTASFASGASTYDTGLVAASAALSASGVLALWNATAGLTRGPLASRSRAAVTTGLQWIDSWSAGDPVRLVASGACGLRDPATSAVPWALYAISGCTVALSTDATLSVWRSWTATGALSVASAELSSEEQPPAHLVLVRAASGASVVALVEPDLHEELRFTFPNESSVDGLRAHVAGAHLLAFGSSVWVSQDCGRSFQRLLAVPPGQRVAALQTAERGLAYAALAWPSGSLFYGRLPVAQYQAGSAVQLPLSGALSVLMDCAGDVLAIVAQPGGTLAAVRAPLAAALGTCSLQRLLQVSPPEVLIPRGGSRLAEYGQRGVVARLTNPGALSATSSDRGRLWNLSDISGNASWGATLIAMDPSAEGQLSCRDSVSVARVRGTGFPGVCAELVWEAPSSERGWASIPTNYRSPSHRGERVFLSSRVYNADPSVKIPTSAFSNDGAAPVLTRCAGAATRAQCSCNTTAQALDPLGPESSDCIRSALVVPFGVPVALLFATPPSSPYGSYEAGDSCNVSAATDVNGRDDMELSLGQRGRAVLVFSGPGLFHVAVGAACCARPAHVVVWVEGTPLQQSHVWQVMASTGVSLAALVATAYFALHSPLARGSSRNT
eukprot:m51a1_g10080 putative C-tail anchored protein, C2 domain (1654) ;mRNA; r:51469-57829